MGFQNRLHPRRRRFGGRPGEHLEIPVHHRYQWRRLVRSDLPRLHPARRAPHPRRRNHDRPGCTGPTRGRLRAIEGQADRLVPDRLDGRDRRLPDPQFLHRGRGVVDGLHRETSRRLRQADPRTGGGREPGLRSDHLDGGHAGFPDRRASEPDRGSSHRCDRGSSRPERVEVERRVRIRDGRHHQLRCSRSGPSRPPPRRPPGPGRGLDGGITLRRDGRGPRGRESNRDGGVRRPRRSIRSTPGRTSSDED